jgi:cell division protease FtsH
MKNDRDDNPNARKEPAEGGEARPPFRNMLLWLVILVLLVSVYQIYDRWQNVVPVKPYNTEFVDMVKAGNVREVKIVQEDMSGRQFLEVTSKNVGPKGPEKFKVDLLLTSDLGLAPLLLENHVPFTYQRSSQFLLLIVSNALPILLFLAVLWFLFSRQMRNMGQGAMSFGKSRARLLSLDRNKVTFKDVAGIDEAKDEVVEIIEFLREPKKFQKLGGRIPKGVLMMGPPGTGKTLLAKAIAGEAGVPFFSISGSDFVEMFVGVGASRVRDMFEQAKRAAPCIIFIDEIDAVGRSRFSGIGGGHDEREQTLNALLVEMDGINTAEGLIVMAATNRPDVLDPALQRPGRFDRQIVLDLPTLEGRDAILKIHARHVPMGRDADLHRLARGTPGFSGADLANLMNEAALLAARQNKEVVGMADLEEARDKVRWGRERRSRILDDKEKRITAYHESGHALVSMLVEESEPLHKITIIPRGRALGSTMQLPEKDRYLDGRRKLMSMLTLFMGGRVAEELVIGDITSGAASDLKEATRIARLMVCSWGMSDLLGPQTFGANEELLFFGREVSRSQDYSEETARKIDSEVNRLLSESHEKAKQLIMQHRDALETLALALLERETLDGEEARAMLAASLKPAVGAEG